jgi:hypothetical protein
MQKLSVQPNTYTLLPIRAALVTLKVVKRDWIKDIGYY